MDGIDLISNGMSQAEALAALRAENQELRAEIRVAHEAAEITAKMVVEEFEKADRLMTQVQATTQEVQRFNEDLAEANRKLSELDRLKSDFLSSVSHELRTPLTSIRGFAKLVGRDLEAILGKLDIKDERLHGKAQRINDNLTIIQEEGERLTRLINDVLDLAKIESGRIDWKMEASDIALLIRQAVAASAGQFADKPAVKLCIELDNDLPAVKIDRDRMVQVLINLLNNAAKFTHQGMVEIRAAKQADNELLLTVRDTGEGFPPEEAEVIFDKFRQVIHGDTLRDKPKGTGLGLSICREIVEHFKGRIWATSEPGVGTLISIALPPTNEPVLHQMPSSQVAADLHGVSTQRTARQEDLADAASGQRLLPLILVVDDDENVCAYLAQLLTQEGFQAVTATNGQEAVEIALAKQPDLVTMDIAMPVMDGDTAIAQFRRDPKLRNIPVVVVSALPSREKSAGDAVLGKPVDEKQLLETIHSLLKEQAAVLVPPAWDVSMPCIVLCHEDPPTQMPPYVRTGQAEYCRLSEFVKRVSDGFEGVVIIPTGMLGHVDFAKLDSMKSVQLLVMPEDSSAPRGPT